MINNVTLVGRLTKDPDLRYTASGTAVATFTLAVNRNFTNQNGNREADFINCVIWRKPAETMATLAKKGSLIGVVGRIQTRTYDNQQGQRVYVTEVVADNFQLLESKAATESRAHADQSSTSPSTTNFEQRDTATPNNNGLNPFGGQSIDISDDDLPF
ncbi:single-stranded DNA-binding protein [Enterococcus faecium]|nr:single-stranded DNA-binding protein [Enterococcus faecium]EME3531464.1 single-stranded DNA-binding protein [Enterococcus faecium]EMF0361216.1 single-stranded DNA-binding protein [Enterococcus faecium]MBU9741973.1 single-stranded DNA-binding protein [Enterococcus faecium]MBY3629247.1 single-stranded DNA-binding protein [Enterococcus faecium]MCU2165069.1 single-stranded DNA-binding protein [Enterococcus faecium]